MNNNKKKIIAVIIFSFGIFLIILGLIINQLGGSKSIFMTSFRHLSENIVSLNNIEKLPHLSKMFEKDYEIIIENNTNYEDKDHKQQLIIQNKDTLKGSLLVLSDNIDFEISEDFSFRLKEKEYLISLEKNYFKEVNPKLENFNVVLKTLEKAFKNTLEEKDFVVTKENKIKKHKLIITKDLEDIFKNELEKLKEDGKVLEAFEDLNFEVNDIEGIEIIFYIKGFNNLVKVEYKTLDTTLLFENDNDIYNINITHLDGKYNIEADKNFGKIKVTNMGNVLEIDIINNKESDTINYKINNEDANITGSIIIKSTKDLSNIKEFTNPKNLDDLEGEEYMELFIDFLSLEIFDELKLDELFEM